MKTLLKEKNILLCISGGIAVYKSLELVRFFKKRGANVRVVMSNEAQKFVTPLSFEALSGEIVLREQSENWTSGGANHISYAMWADVCILAPCTINTLCKFAHGIADNLLLSTLLACSAPILIAPSANSVMYLSSQSQEAMNKLQKRGVKLIPARHDLLACGVEGVGAMAEIEEIGYEAMRVLLTDPFWSGKDVVLSGGGSSEEIDEVRCISNHSSGLQASYLALALYLLGANVTFITSKTPLKLPDSISLKKALSTQDFYTLIRSSLKEGGYYFGVGALSDFKPKTKLEGKVKKSQGLQVEFVPTIDVLASLKIPSLTKIGFKAEKDPNKAREYARAMLKDKGCKYVCLNIIAQENAFGSENNSIILIDQNQERELAMQSKFSLSFALLKIIAND